MAISNGDSGNRNAGLTLNKMYICMKVVRGKRVVHPYWNFSRHN